MVRGEGSKVARLLAYFLEGETALPVPAPDAWATSPGSNVSTTLLVSSLVHLLCWG